MIFPDIRFHDQNGHLFPYDVAFDAADRAHLEWLENGTVRFRVRTEPGFATCHVVFADGSGFALERSGTGRFRWWEGAVTPPSTPIGYTFAFRTEAGKAVYVVPAGIGNAVERLDRWHLEGGYDPTTAVPEWAKGAVMYQIFPERFHNGDPAADPADVDPWGTPPHWLRFQGGDLTGIAKKIDYLSALNVDIVYLNPIFSSPSTHRYDATDFMSVDSSLGGNEALRHLVSTVHGAGMRLIVDASFNHCHPRFFAFADVVEHGEESPYRDWFVIDEFPIKVRVRPEAFKEARDPATYADYIERIPRQTGVPVEEIHGPGPMVEPTYEAWYGVPTMPRINLANPDARAYFIDIGTHWITEYGIDGWRMDVARYVDADFWPEFRKAVKAVRPDAYLLGEFMGDAGPWVQGHAFDATMNYTFQQLCLDYFATDAIGSAALCDGVERMLAQYAPDVVAASQNLLGSHDTPRFLNAAGGESHRLRAATIFQMTMPGIAGLYYGDEIGMAGGEDPDNRGAFEWNEGEWDMAQHELVRDLSALRHEVPALRNGSYRTVPVPQPDVIAFERGEGSHRVLVVITKGVGLEEFDIRVDTQEHQVIWGHGVIEPRGHGVRLGGVRPWSGLIVRL